MKITRKADTNLWKRPIGDLQPGDVIINGEGNLCLILRRTVEDLNDNKTRLAGLESGTSYAVKNTTEYEVVNAEVVWQRKQVTDGVVS